MIRRAGWQQTRVVLSDATVAAYQADARKEADAAFAAAIATGRLTEQSAADYMYMGKARDGRGAFKHRNTKEYLA